MRWSMTLYQLQGSSMCLRNVMVCAASPANVIFPSWLFHGTGSQLYSRVSGTGVPYGIYWIADLKGSAIFAVICFSSASISSCVICHGSQSSFHVFKIWNVQVSSFSGSGVSSTVDLVSYNPPLFFEGQATNLTATRRCHQGGSSTRKLGEGCAQPELALPYTLPQGWS
jgi:hypothetical protein